MKTGKINFAFILIFIASFSIPCFTQEKTDSLLVEINIFSGRPNPGFVIADPGIVADVRNLIRQGTDSLVNAAAAVDSDTVKNYVPKLGYRGLRITDIGPEGKKEYVIREQMLFQVIRPEPSKGKAFKSPVPHAYRDNLGIERKLLRIGLDNRLIEPSLSAQLPSRLK